ncbi:hypothetical protein [Sphingomonas sp. CFBP8993]|uniref:hypothetical protein n=1 Tax=Sphingomonas sp. CFBP8993 TaxID=3096526 RepID=UPI002A6AAFF9|nr:hypothetical protein [Sphingomonas sp. CFBP8993]
MSLKKLMHGLWLRGADPIVVIGLIFCSLLLVAVGGLAWYKLAPEVVEHRVQAYTVSHNAAPQTENVRTLPYQPVEEAVGREPDGSALLQVPGTSVHWRVPFILPSWKEADDGNERHEPAGDDTKSHAATSGAAGDAQRYSPGGYEPYCRNPQTSSDSDLCAQWAAVREMAIGNGIARSSLRFGLWTIMASIGAAALSLLGLVVAAQAVNIAAEASRGRGADDYRPLPAHVRVEPRLGFLGLRTIIEVVNDDNRPLRIGAVELIKNGRRARVTLASDSGGWLVPGNTSRFGMRVDEPLLRLRIWIEDTSGHCSISEHEFRRNARHREKASE